MYDFFYIKEGERFWQVPFAEIQYFESRDKYTKVITTKREYLALQSMNAVEKALPADLFIRIHRSYIISLLHTSSFSSTVVYVGNKKLSIGRQYRTILNNSVLTLGNNLAFGGRLSNFDLLKLFRKTGFN